MLYLWPPWSAFYGVCLQACKVTDQSLSPQRNTLNKVMFKSRSDIYCWGQPSSFKRQMSTAAVSKETHFLFNKNILEGPLGDSVSGAPRSWFGCGHDLGGAGCGIKPQVSSRLSRESASLLPPGPPLPPLSSSLPKINKSSKKYIFFASQPLG